MPTDLDGQLGRSARDRNNRSSRERTGLLLPDGKTWICNSDLMEKPFSRERRTNTKGAWAKQKGGNLTVCMVTIYLSIE